MMSGFQLENGHLRNRVEGCREPHEVELVVKLALADASAVRGWRVARRIAAQVDAPGPPDEVLGRITATVSASVEIERLLSPGDDGPVDLGVFVDRFATLRAIANGGPMRLRTSVPRMSASRHLARAVVYGLCELVEMVEAMGEEMPDLMVAVNQEEGELVVAVAAIGAEECPVPVGIGAAALRRVERLATGLGGDVVRGVRDGMMLFGVTLPVMIGGSW